MAHRANRESVLVGGSYRAPAATVGGHVVAPVVVPPGSPPPYLGLKLRDYTNGNRPTPAFAGKSAIINNTDDGALNISDGVKWRTAAGDIT